MIYIGKKIKLFLVRELTRWVQHKGSNTFGRKHNLGKMCDVCESQNTEYSKYFILTPSPSGKTFDCWCILLKVYKILPYDLLDTSFPGYCSLSWISSDELDQSLSKFNQNFTKQNLKMQNWYLSFCWIQGNVIEMFYLSW